MALSATKAAKVSFVLDAAPNFIIEDVSPYVSEGIALADVVGIIKLTGPSGIIYENTDFDAPDIDANVSLSKSDIAIPVDSSGAALLGTYVLTYTIRVGGAVQAGDYVVSKTVSFTFVIPTAAIAMTSNVWAARLDSKDDTTYTVDTIIPSLARTHTVMFEDNKKVANTVGSAAIVSVSYPNFWTGRYTTDLSTIATYNLGSNWYVVATIAGKETHDIVADLTACSVSCGIKNMNQRYRNAVKKGNDELVEELTLTLNRISLLLALFKLLQLCGDTDGATETLVMIKEEGEFTDDCCSGDSPQQILPLAPDLASNYEVTAGLGMVVVPSSGGGTTSFEVALQQALKDKIDVLIKTLIEAGTGIDVSYDDTSYVRVYTISSTVTSASQVEELAMKFVMASAATVTLNEKYRHGTIFANGGLVVAINGTSGLPAKYRLYAFKTNGAGSDFYAWFMSVKSTAYFPFEIQVYNVTAQLLEFALYDKTTGLPATVGAVQSFLTTRPNTVEFNFLLKYIAA